LNNVVTQNTRDWIDPSTNQVDTGVATDSAAPPGNTGSSDNGSNAAASSQSVSASTPTVGGSVNDYGTNNQETGIEEGDLVVSDGNVGEWI
jgi:hypothetical protein